MTSKLYIPKKLRVGFVSREDTYTGKLAYVIYFDEKDKLRKAGSFESWRDKDIPTLDLDNAPFDGFVLNKSITHYSWDHFSSDRTRIRIYDQRGIEFEIEAENLLGILTQVDCIKRDLVGQFVYAWAGNKLVLLPCCSDEYKKAVAFTEVRNQRLTAKQLVPGTVYKNKDDVELLFLGKLPVAENVNGYYSNGLDYVRKKKFLFVPAEAADKDQLKIESRTDAGNYISCVAREGVHPNFGSLCLKYENQKIHHFDVKELVLMDLDETVFNDLMCLDETVAVGNDLTNIFKLNPVKTKTEVAGDVSQYFYYGQFKYSFGELGEQKLRHTYLSNNLCSFVAFVPKFKPKVGQSQEQDDEVEYGEPGYDELLDVSVVIKDYLLTNRQLRELHYLPTSLDTFRNIPLESRKKLYQATQDFWYSYDTTCNFGSMKDLNDKKFKLVYVKFSDDSLIPLGRVTNGY